MDSTDNQAETVANPTEQPQPEKPQPEVKPEQPQTYDDLFPSLPTAAPGIKLFLSRFLITSLFQRSYNLYLSNIVFANDLIFIFYHEN